MAADSNSLPQSQRGYVEMEKEIMFEDSDAGEKASPPSDRDGNLIPNVRIPDFLPFHTLMSMIFIQ